MASRRQIITARIIAREVVRILPESSLPRGASTSFRCDCTDMLLPFHDFSEKWLASAVVGLSTGERVCWFAEPGRLVTEQLGTNKIHCVIEYRPAFDQFEIGLALEHDVTSEQVKDIAELEAMYELN